jgi:3,4-dihydroxy 2-butanone 4-phosphate synthase/GTP cyclohydrolase II
VPDDLVQPGHIFPLQAVDGGVLMRAGHTEAGCDLAAMAGCTPASVICEIMKDDGTMARLPDLQLFAAEHGLKIGTIADLIEYRSRTESLMEKLGSRPMQTAFGEFTAHAFRDTAQAGACTWHWSKGWTAEPWCPCVYTNPCPCSMRWRWAVPCTPGAWTPALQHMQSQGPGVVVLLNCGESGEQLLAQFEGTARSAQAPERGRMDLRTYGVGRKYCANAACTKCA